MKKWVVVVFFSMLVCATRADATVWMTCTGNDGRNTITVEMITGTGMEWEYLDREVLVRINEDTATEITIPKRFVQFYRISEYFVNLYIRGFDGPDSTLAVFFSDDDFMDRTSMIEFKNSDVAILADQNVTCSY